MLVFGYSADNKISAKGGKYLSQAAMPSLEHLGLRKRSG